MSMWTNFNVKIKCLIKYLMFDQHFVAYKLIVNRIYFGRPFRSVSACEATVWQRIFLQFT